MQEVVNMSCSKKKCLHAWKPIIVFSPLLYVRECQICGEWRWRDKIDEWNNQSLYLERLLKENSEEEL